MRVSIVCNDTRGGIQPYLGLGLGIRRTGAEVEIVAPEGYRNFIESTGLFCRGLSGDVHAMLKDPEVVATMEKGFWATHKLMIAKAGQMIRDSMAECLSACTGADLIIAGFGGMITAESVAEKLRVPFVQAHLQPLATTGSYPGLLSVKGLRSISLFNRLSHAVSKQVFWQPMRKAVNAARQEILNLPSARFWGNVGVIRKPDEIILYGYSPSLLPRPSDLPPGHHITGYWFLDYDSGWMPPPELKSFLAAGPKPVVIGFGSMMSRDTDATTRLALTAAKLAKQRVVLLSGWGGMSQKDLPDYAYMIESVPHSWLFPRCSVAVHHGGAGTIGASLRAGIPTIVVPFAADQPFWASLIESQRLGVCAGSRRRLTADKLARTITKCLTDSRIQTQSFEMGQKVRSEDGIRTAVGILQKVCLGQQANTKV